jgi:hypothetical protein
MELLAAEPVLFTGGRHVPCRETRRKPMIKVSAFALAVTFAVAGVASSALAQASPSSNAKAATASHHQARVSGRETGRGLYNMVPGGVPARNGDDPSATGGGSIGYNQMLYNW